MTKVEEEKKAILKKLKMEKHPDVRIKDNGNLQIYMNDVCSRWEVKGYNDAVEEINNKIERIENTLE